MPIPGFTASSSLYGTKIRFYQSTRRTKTDLSAIEAQLPVGGGESNADCLSKYQNCYVDCSVRYPESTDSIDNLNELMRQGCFDSCDAAYNLCSDLGGWSSSSGVFLS
jgi:hypothetical protein